MLNTKYRILLIEDDIVDQMAFRKMIKAERLDYQYSIASSVEEAQGYIRDEKFDLIIADFNLGDGSAFDIFDLIHDTPFIFTTGEGNEEIAARALRAGASDYLIKDHDRNYLKLLPYAIFTSIVRSKNNRRLELLESVVVNAHDSIVVLEASVDNPLNIQAVYVNNAFMDMSGFDEKELQFKAWEVLFSEDNDPELIQSVKNCLERKTPVRGELICYKHDGEKYWVDINLVPIDHPETGYSQFVAILRDVTERKKVEAALIQARNIADEARQREKAFLANMSHEIRNPIQTILNICHLLKNTSLDDKQEKYISSLKFTSDFLVGLVNDILEQAKIEAGEIQFEEIPFQLSAFIEKIYNSYQYRLEGGDVVMNYSIASDVPDALIGDPTKLNQIISNLLSNAVKFTSQGTINLDISLERLEGHTAFLNISVSDSGIGIPPEKIESIFDRYKQAEAKTTRKYGGTGLGLSIVKHLVELRGGQINVSSVVDQGTTFAITIPFSFQENPEENKSLAKEPVAVVPRNPDKKHRVLIVDDNTTNLRLTRQFVENWNIVAEIAENGLVAKNILQKQTFDLVLTDINMPKMTGKELSAWIRQETANPNHEVPVVAMTAGLQAGNRRELYMAGIDTIIGKPFEPEALHEVLALYLELPSFSIAEGTPSLVEERDIANIDHLYKVSNNNPAFIREMVEIFLNEMPKSLGELKKALFGQDWVEVTRHAHFLRSTVKTSGNREISRLFSEIETIASKGEPEATDIGSLFRKAEQLSLDLISAMKKIYSELPPVESDMTGVS